MGWFGALFRWLNRINNNALRTHGFHFIPLSISRPIFHLNNFCFERADFLQQVLMFRLSQDVVLLSGNDLLLHVDDRALELSLDGRVDESTSRLRRIREVFKSNLKG